LDHQAEQSKSMVRIFEPVAGFDRRRQFERGDQLLVVEIRPAVGEISGVGAVAGETGAMRQKLRNGRLRNLLVQVLSVLSARITQSQFAPFAQLHDSGRSKTLGMRRDPKPVTRRQLLAGVEIGVPESVLGDHLAPMGDRNAAAGLLRGPQLKFDPAAGVVHRVWQPWFHLCTKCREGRRARESSGMVFGWYPAKQNRDNPKGLGALAP